MLSALHECLQYDSVNHLDNTNEINLNNFVLDNTSINKDRLELPANWNNSVLHRLPDNYTLSHSGLKSTLEKYQKLPDKLNQYN